MLIVKTGLMLDLKGMFQAIIIARFTITITINANQIRFTSVLLKSSQLLVFRKLSSMCNGDLAV